MSIFLVLLGLLVFAGVLQAQQVCPGLPYIANTPEDELMQAVNGAEKPEEQIAALDKYVQAHADSKFMPCVDEYYTMTYLKLANYDKVVEYAEKGLASNYKDVMLVLNLLKGYVGSGKVTDSAFEVIFQAPELIAAESKPTRPTGVSQADWQKTLEDNAAQAKDELAYVVYAFLQLVPRMSDPNKEIEQLDRFAKAFPEDAAKNVAQIDFDYFMAWRTRLTKPSSTLRRLSPWIPTTWRLLIFWLTPTPSAAPTLTRLPIMRTKPSHWRSK
jgi:tetratricopeptide (TPR) repeat protein